MSTPAIWNGSSNFTPGNTPFGFYDNDLTFQQDADKVAKFCAIRLGYPLMDVELNSQSFYTCFEEAVTTYGNEIYQAIVVQNYIGIEGADNTAPLNNAVLSPSLQNVITISSGYGTEAGVGGSVTRYSGSLYVTPDSQVYDLNQWAQDNNIKGRIEITKVFYEAPPAILRFFDPYAGTGTGIQSLMDAFDFGSYSPGVNFLLMPASFDLLTVQAIEFNDQIRRSGYSFEIVNNHLKLFPVPKQPGYIWFEYYLVNEKQVLDNSANTPGGPGGSVTNISNVPFENPTYSEINSIGKQWIYKYTVALAKEMLAQIRGKYTQIPIPGSDVTLNQQDLLTDARAEKQALIENLRSILDTSSRVSQLERKSQEATYLQDTLQHVPMVIFVA